MSTKKRYAELDEHYELQETLGSGGFAKVKAAIHKLTGEKVAIKIMDKKQLGADLPRVYREIRVLKQLHHQHICQLFEVIETHSMIYMVLEFCPGGELFDYIVAKERLKEKEARSFFRQILAALHYVHECGFIHRDLKPENLLLDEESNIKLIDFGLVAEPTDTQDMLQTCCGSPAYAAPELIRGGPYIGTKADVWSLGVLLYALLNGFLPFDDDHTPYLYRLIQRGEYEIPNWLKTGSIAIIARLLQTDPERRITMERLLHHPWVMDGFEAPVDWESRIDLTEIDSQCVAALAHYHGKSHYEMAAEIVEWRYDEVTVAYLLLLQQKHHGKTPHIRVPPKLNLSAVSISTGSSSSTLSPLAKNSFSNLNGVEFAIGDKKDNEESNGSSSSSSSLTEDAFHTPPNAPHSYDQPVFNPQIYSSSAPAQRANGVLMGEEEIPTLAVPEEPPRPSFREHRRVSLGQPMHPPAGEIVSLQKKPVNPVVAYIKDEGQLLEAFSASPSPSPRTPSPINPPLTPPVTHPPMPTSNSTHFRQHLATRPKEKVKKTRSYDARLNHLITEQPVPAPLTPTMGRRTPRPRIGSIEGLFKKAKLVFKLSGPSEQGPRKIKGVYDVSSTSLKPAHEVLTELERVLQQMNVTYRRKNYILRCQVPSYKSSTKVKMIEFNLEVCILPQVDMIGVRRKRIKGDTWEYKRICDQVFKSTKL